jgi:hypothetical protein
MPEQEKTSEEILAEQLAEQKARGDFAEESEEEELDGVQAAEEEEPEEEELEAEEEPVLEAESEEEDEPGAKADETIMVPKGRLDEVLHKSREREQELQRRLNAAEERKQQETTTKTVDELEKDLDELDSKYAELLLEGEVEKANAARKEWRQKQNDLLDIRLEQRSSLASQQAVESMRFDRQLAEHEIQFPVINPDSEDFSQEVADEVNGLMGAFQAQGWNLVAALNKAVKYVIPAEADAFAKGLDPNIVRTKRQVAARKKVADLAKKSPPDITDKGRDTDKIGTGDGLPDVTKMTPEQFADLSVAQLRELRGDKLTDQEATS